MPLNYSNCKYLARTLLEFILDAHHDILQNFS